MQIPAGLVAARNSRQVRWYVLTLPTSHRGRARGLQEELDRRIRNSEPEFEYFAPVYVEVRKQDGRWVETSRPLLYNYVFVRASENEIFRMMTSSGMSAYSFLPRVRTEQEQHYPYISDSAMENLRWVARSYSNVLPVCSPKPEMLRRGDRVRITEGRFKNAEAVVMVQPGAGQKDVMVSVDSWLCVPLMHVKSGQYEVIELGSQTDSRLYARMSDDKLLDKLHQAMGRRIRNCAEEGDEALARRTVQMYGALQMSSDVMRCRHYALLLPAYAILGDEQRLADLLEVCRGILPLVKARQAQALLLVTLYGCTDSSIWHQKAHAIADGWRSEPSQGKLRQMLLRHLDDFDRWLGHLPAGDE